MTELSEIRLRPPDMVMRLDRMGASHPTRLSFMRQLIRRLNCDRASVARNLWEIDSDGYGRAVYSLRLGGQTYSLCAFTSPLADEDRTDRVIAEAWDATFVLYDGIPDGSELGRLARNAVRQEAGRYGPRDLVLSRANKSMRMFDHVTDSLASGRQPSESMVRRIGYLMRTTAVYGNGKFGLADRSLISSRPAMAPPFQPELLTVWLVRGFTHDLAEHLARCRAPVGAAVLSPENRKQLGIGNATGLGMAPFLISHPVLIHNWILARETALARVCARKTAMPDTLERFQTVYSRARRHVAEIEIEDTEQAGRNRTLLAELDSLQPAVLELDQFSPFPWKRLTGLSSRHSLECQEMIASLVIEPHAELADPLCAGMASETEAEISPSASTDDLRMLLGRSCAWALETDFADPAENRMFWYVSEEKLEPRRGDRERDSGSESALPLDVARQYRELDEALRGCRGQTAAEFLSARPHLRHIVRRLQTLAAHPYSEVRGNLAGFTMRPIDLLRCKLAFFGATHFDPKSDLWTRITMYKGAPDFQTIQNSDADDWCFPACGTA